MSRCICLKSTALPRGVVPSSAAGGELSRLLFLFNPPRRYRVHLGASYRSLDPYARTFMANHSSFRGAPCLSCLIRTSAIKRLLSHHGV